MIADITNDNNSTSHNYLKIPRQANQRAHSLATQAMQHSSAVTCIYSCVNMEHLHTCLVQLALQQLHGHDYSIAFVLCM